MGLPVQMVMDKAGAKQNKKIKQKNKQDDDEGGDDE